MELFWLRTELISTTKCLNNVPKTVTKMKKNQRFEIQKSYYRVNEKGLIVLNDAEVIFTTER